MDSGELSGRSPQFQAEAQLPSAQAEASYPSFTQSPTVKASASPAISTERIQPPMQFQRTLEPQYLPARLNPSDRVLSATLKKQGAPPAVTKCTTQPPMQFQRTLEPKCLPARFNPSDRVLPATLKKPVKAPKVGSTSRIVTCARSYGFAAFAGLSLSVCELRFFRSKRPDNLAAAIFLLLVRPGLKSQTSSLE